MPDFFLINAALSVPTELLAMQEPASVTLGNVPPHLNLAKQLLGTKEIGLSACLTSIEAIAD
jgi:hypothetical protein